MIAETNGHQPPEGQEPAPKRIGLSSGGWAPSQVEGGKEVKKTREKIKGLALIKKEFLIQTPGELGAETGLGLDDDAAESQTAPPVMGDNAYVPDGRDADGRGSKNAKGGGRRKQGGQNKGREFGKHVDAIRLCNSVAFYPEFSPGPCKFGDRCNSSHDIRKYLKDGRYGDLDTFGGRCPCFEANGRCPAGWKCRFVSSHMKEVRREDGRMELVLESALPAPEAGPVDIEGEKPGIVNVVPVAHKTDLARKRMALTDSEKYLEWMDKDAEMQRQLYTDRKTAGQKDEAQDYRAAYVEPPLKASEKRRIYFGCETPALAPLTTQGNLPFRRLCVELGAQATYSEMALGLPLVQGNKIDWALMKAHETEAMPPCVRADSTIPQDYDNARDLRFGAQIAANQPRIVVKATEALTRLVKRLRLVDLNCGCPVDNVYKSGAGSALLDAPTKLDRMIRGMNAVSGEVPISAKIRMGVRDGRPTADKLVQRLAFGHADTRAWLGAPGCAALTLHGRTRQQRYTKLADWGYISHCAALIKSHQQEKADLADTIRETDESSLANTPSGKMYFLGNGDCYTYLDYYDHLENAGVDTVMIGRGALIKPWLFEEIEKGQYLDKSASERLGYVEKFVRYGLEAWGSDEMGIGLTRRFTLEFMSFFHRYIPVGILDYLPPAINDRPPAFKGRNELETLLASDNYKDWIKVSEMFLGPVHADFKFQPKHKSNSYDIEAEG